MKECNQLYLRFYTIHRKTTAPESHPPCPYKTVQDKTVPNSKIFPDKTVPDKIVPREQTKQSQTK